MNPVFSTLIQKTQAQLKQDKQMKTLEQAWARYKYLVLEYSPKNYQAIRQLLKDKSSYPAEAFITLVEESLNQTPSQNVQVNAYDHVWGYFKKGASPSEKEKYQHLLADFQQGEASSKEIKSFLYQLALEYKQDYLIKSYFFADI